MSERPEGADAASIELIVAMNRFSDRVDALNKSGTNQTVTLSGGSFGVWVPVIFCLVAALCSGFALYETSETKAELRATQIMLKDDIRQLENTDNAIRAYINTGKMPPAPEKK